MTTITESELRQKLQKFIEEISEADLREIAESVADIAWVLEDERFETWPTWNVEPADIRHLREIAFRSEGMGDSLEADDDGALLMTDEHLEETKSLLQMKIDEICEDLFAKLQERQDG